MADDADIREDTDETPFYFGEAYSVQPDGRRITVEELESQATWWTGFDRHELKNDRGWLTAAGRLYEFEAQQFSASLATDPGLSQAQMRAAAAGKPIPDEAESGGLSTAQAQENLADWLMETVRAFDGRTTATGYWAADILATDNQEAKEAFVYAICKYNTLQGSLTGLGWGAYYAIADPINLVGGIGVLTKGAKLLGLEKLGTMALKESLKASLKAGGLGMATGATFSALHDSARQGIMINAGAQDDWRVSQSAMATVMGGVFGGALGAAIPHAGKAARHVWDQIPVINDFSPGPRASKAFRRTADKTEYSGYTSQVDVLLNHPKFQGEGGNAARARFLQSLHTDGSGRIEAAKLNQLLDALDDAAGPPSPPELPLGQALRARIFSNMTPEQRTALLDDPALAASESARLKRLDIDMQQRAAPEAAAAKVDEPAAKTGSGEAAAETTPPAASRLHGMRPEFDLPSQDNLFGGRLAAIPDDGTGMGVSPERRILRSPSDEGPGSGTPGSGASEAAAEATARRSTRAAGRAERRELHLAKTRFERLETPEDRAEFLLKPENHPHWTVLLARLDESEANPVFARLEQSAKGKELLSKITREGSEGQASAAKSTSGADTAADEGTATAGTRNGPEGEGAATTGTRAESADDGTAAAGARQTPEDDAAAARGAEDPAEGQRSSPGTAGTADDGTFVILPRNHAQIGRLLNEFAELRTPQQKAEKLLEIDDPEIRFGVFHHGTLKSEAPDINTRFAILREIGERDPDARLQIYDFIQRGVAREATELGRAIPHLNDRALKLAQTPIYEGKSRWGEIGDRNSGRVEQIYRNFIDAGRRIRQLAKEHKAAGKTADEAENLAKDTVAKDLSKGLEQLVQGGVRPDEIFYLAKWSRIHMLQKTYQELMKPPYDPFGNIKDSYPEIYKLLKETYATAGSDGIMADKDRFDLGLVHWERTTGIHTGRVNHHRLDSPDSGSFNPDRKYEFWRTLKKATGYRSDSIYSKSGWSLPLIHKGDRAGSLGSISKSWFDFATFNLFEYSKGSDPAWIPWKDAKFLPEWMQNIPGKAPPLKWPMRLTGLGAGSAFFVLPGSIRAYDLYGDDTPGQIDQGFVSTLGAPTLEGVRLGTRAYGYAIDAVPNLFANTGTLVANNAFDADWSYGYHSIARAPGQWIAAGIESDAYYQGVARVAIEDKMEGYADASPARQVEIIRGLHDALKTAGESEDQQSAAEAAAISTLINKLKNENDPAYRAYEVIDGFKALEDKDDEYTSRDLKEIERLRGVRNGLSDSDDELAPYAAYLDRRIGAQSWRKLINKVSDAALQDTMADARDIGRDPLSSPHRVQSIQDEIDSLKAHDADAESAQRELDEARRAINELTVQAFDRRLSDIAQTYEGRPAEALEQLAIVQRRLTEHDTFSAALADENHDQHERLTELQQNIETAIAEAQARARAAADAEQDGETAAPATPAARDFVAAWDQAFGRESETYHHDFGLLQDTFTGEGSYGTAMYGLGERFFHSASNFVTDTLPGFLDKHGDPDKSSPMVAGAVQIGTLLAAFLGIRGLTDWLQNASVTSMFSLKNIVAFGVVGYLAYHFTKPGSMWGSDGSAATATQGTGAHIPHTMVKIIGSDGQVYPQARIKPGSNLTVEDLDDAMPEDVEAKHVLIDSAGERILLNWDDLFDEVQAGSRQAYQTGSQAADNRLLGTKVTDLVDSYALVQSGEEVNVYGHFVPDELTRFLPGAEAVKDENIHKMHNPDPGLQQ